MWDNEKLICVRSFTILPNSFEEPGCECADKKHCQNEIGGKGYEGNSLTVHVELAKRDDHGKDDYPREYNSPLSKELLANYIESFGGQAVSSDRIRSEFGDHKRGFYNSLSILQMTIVEFRDHRPWGISEFVVRTRSFNSFSTVRKLMHSLRLSPSAVR